mgnify:CR=1 FL=1
MARLVGLCLVVRRGHNHDIQSAQKRRKKFVEKTEKGVDKVVLRWYYSQAVRRESDTESR